MLATVSGIATAESKKQTSITPETRKQLRKLIAQIEEVDPDFPKMRATLAAGSKKFSAKQLKSMELHVLKSNDDKIKGISLHIFIHRDRFAAAAKLTVASSADQKEPAYGIWKTWEHIYGKRKDYKALTRKFGLALLHEFESGDKKTKLIVSRIFSKGEGGAKMSNAEFRKAVGLGKSKEKQK